MADYVARTGGDYTYDANGNMIYDPAKQGTIKYNYLNLPERVDLGTKGKIYYHYDAAGNKLAKYIENTTSSENTKTEYIANLVYTNGQKSFFSTEEGRAIPIEKDGNIRWHYEYNLKDHLGNTRVTFGGSNLGGAADIVQTSSYYPFGMVMAQENFNSGGNSYQLNKYLYNGKELQSNEFEGASLDWYDYGARFYDPSLGRFGAIDPLCEFMPNNSPYVYAGNNPISYIDYNGEHPVLVIGGIILTAVDVALLATGVIASGMILHQAADGGFAINSNITELFAKSKESFKRRTKGGKRKRNYSNKTKAANRRAVNNNYNINGWQPDGHEGQAFAAAGAFAGMVWQAFNFYRSNRENINYGHDEFKVGNLNSFYPNINLEMKSALPIEMNVSNSESQSPTIDPSKIPVPETPKIIPTGGPSPLPMPIPNPPKPQLDPVPDRPFPIPLNM